MTGAIDPKEIIARRVAREIRPGMLVNLGIGLPSLVANYLPPDAGVFFQAENGVIGLGARPPEGMEEVRQAAPYAYRRQERAVTPEDYAEVALRHPDVQRAVEEAVLELIADNRESDLVEEGIELAEVA